MSKRGTVGKVNLPKLEERSQGSAQIGATQVSRGMKNDRSLGGSPSHKQKSVIKPSFGLADAQ